METTVHWLSLAFDQIVAFLPNLIAGLVIMLIGYVIALLLGKATRTIAARLGFDRFIARLGLSEQSGRRAPSHVLGRIVLLVVMVTTIMQAARAWKLSFVANGLAEMIAYLPHVLAAAVVFSISLFLGNWVRDRLSRPRAGVPLEAEPSRVLPSAVRAGILAVGSFMALRELQIAPEIVNAAFILSLASVAIASALAFGLGGRQVAGQLAQSWYERRDVARWRRPGVIEATPSI